MDSITDINGRTQFAAVIGQPLSHSLSPIIYNTAFKAQDVNMVYLAFETSEAETIDRIEHLKALGVQGINVTMPGKMAAMATVDALDKAAAYVQAVNMITTNEDGKWIGYNTDGAGLWLAVKNRDVALAGKRLVIFGSGATSRIILAQAVLEGMLDITVIARKIQEKDHLLKVAQALTSDYPDLALNLVDLADSAGVEAAVTKAEIVIQSTSVGMSGSKDQSILANAEWLQAGTVVIDVIYEQLETTFMKQAKSRHCQVIGGLDMLVFQAKLNYQLFAHRDLPVDRVFETIQSRIHGH
ncbi:shikimate dehydrogenase [Aerococcus sp. 1KP-2016]|uniref:shikimate dehydrogenase family protein n=1 Tax=Aerococcus sp. 1KP-2016 TaxID=1981982 RepID=UPI000B982164|nr:shikimate dehydrogenase [Aerococcus sp. 1KP-2016]OYQ68233.1 shikimate dehydrogenase [Aerococcus sp. 1KP-2016]